MKSTQSVLLATVGITCLVTALIVVPSRSGHSAGGAVPVQVTGTAIVSDTDNPARHTVQFKMAPYSHTTDTATASYTVPAGKRLVIEYVSAQMLEYPNDGGYSGMDLVTTAGGDQEYYPLASASADTNQETNQVVRIYADPGTTVQASAYASGGTDVSGLTIVSGYLVNLP